MKYICNSGNPIAAEIEATKENIAKFQKTWVGNRIMTAVSMAVITCVLMFNVPKFYMWASGKNDPNATDIYEEADRRKKVNR